ncbi:esterase/lipase family protein [Nodularia spumigena]|uniref:esterase/lipase family protein n=1 Tax=Nodularia spumigena TaxID=70799 RepID=UPI002B21AEA1|nr:alpha/beta hydrolase [Nodularia spumigena]MEA5558035.1 alpha/beta hydrolase [Nodularia spumigena CH309]
MNTERSAAERILSESRSLLELGGYAAALPWLPLLGRGDGHQVLVLPGFSTSDRSTVPMRNALRLLGYRSHGWRLGVNRGPNRALLAAMRDRLDALYARDDAPVSIVGWSLGGVYARGLARRDPAKVRQVITLGSPFRPIEAARGWPPPPVPSTAVFSRRDAVVRWQDASDEPDRRRENVEIDSSHFGLGHNPATMVVLADRLAQDIDFWRPFDPPRPLRRLFPAGSRNR